MKKQAGEAKKRGRPALPENERRRSNLTLRIRHETRQALEVRAATNGRSLSEETEALIEHALQGGRWLAEALDLAWGPEAAALALLLGRIAHAVGTASGAQPWMTNAYAFSQVEKGIATALEALRPAGDVTTPPPNVWDIGVEPFAVPGGTTVLGESMARSLLALVANNPRIKGDLLGLVN